MALNAFFADEAAKRAAQERLARLWDERKVAPGMKLNWNSQEQSGTLSGALAEDKDADAFPVRTGLPLALSQTVEVLMLAGSRTRDRQLQLPERLAGLYADWLAAVRPGADLGGVLPRFVSLVLDELLKPGIGPGQHMDAAQRQVVRQIAAMVSGALQGEAIAAKDWRGPRNQALALADSLDDPWCAAVAEFAAGVAWPPAQIADEAGSLLQRLIGSWGGFLTLEVMTAQERVDATEAAREPQRMRRAAAEPGFDLMNWHMAQMKAKTEGVSKEAQEQAAARRLELRDKAGPAIEAMAEWQAQRLIELTRAA